MIICLRCKRELPATQFHMVAVGKPQEGLCLRCYELLRQEPPAVDAPLDLPPPAPEPFGGNPKELFKPF